MTPLSHHLFRLEDLHARLSAAADVAARLVLPLAMAGSTYLMIRGIVALVEVPLDTGGSMSLSATDGNPLLSIGGVACRDSAGIPLATAPGKVQVTLSYGRDGRVVGCVGESGGGRAL